MIRGISFEIPNEYGKFLEDILKPFKVGDHNWWIGGEESYIIQDGKLEALFPRLIECMEDETLKNAIKNNDYYLLFQDLKALPKGSELIEETNLHHLTSSQPALALRW